MRAAAAVLALAALACGRERAASPPAPTATVTVAIAEGSAATVPLLAGATPLATVLPPAPGSAWTAVEVRGVDTITLEPFATYGDLRLELTAGSDGVAFAGYRVPARDAPPHVVRALAEPRFATTGVTAIVVRASPTRPELPAFAPIPLRVAGRDARLGAGDLGDVTPVELPRRAGTPPALGWPLTDVTRALGAEGATVILTSAEGTEELAPAALRGDVRYFLRPNNRQQLGVRAFRGDTEVLHVRALTRLELRAP